MRPRTRRIVVAGRAALLVASTACAGASETADLAADVSDSGVVTNDGDSSTQPYGTTSTEAEPAWWTVGGQLVVSGGALDPSASVLQLTVSSRDGIILCTTESALESATPQDAGDDAVHALWTVSLLGAPGCDDMPVPTTFDLGLGAYDPQLEPALATSLDGSALYGLYLRDDSELYVFGIAGTSAQWSGTAPPPAPPLADGTYTAQALHLLPL